MEYGMKNQEAPKFNRLQLEYLQRAFPEITDCYNTDELIHNNGKRTVVKHIEHLIDSAERAAIGVNRIGS